jgi:uncharacterized protein YkwD
MSAKTTLVSINLPKTIKYISTTTTQLIPLTTTTPRIISTTTTTTQPTPTIISTTTTTTQPTTTTTTQPTTTTTTQPTTTTTTQPTTTTTTQPTTTQPSPTIILSDIDIILKMHNDERRLQSVGNLTWSILLKNNAQTISNNIANNDCILQHNLLDGTFGQNLYAGYGWTSGVYSDAIKAWLDEKSLVNIPGIPFSQVGHYLIIISNNFKNVGCAKSINFFKNCFVITCDYS